MFAERKRAWDISCYPPYPSLPFSDELLVPVICFNSWKDKHDTHHMTFCTQHTLHRNARSVRLGSWLDFGIKQTGILNPSPAEWELTVCSLWGMCRFGGGFRSKDGRAGQSFRIYSSSLPWPLWVFHCQVGALFTALRPPSLLPGLQGGTCSRN